mmetsp:Transcript_59494/g.106129  ORF Transcript_59494/g.106129 Transcript_59494/m.106129 type:complete len:81 (-) Transcript_59494:404-646(-)
MPYTLSTSGVHPSPFDIRNCLGETNSRTASSGAQTGMPTARRTVWVPGVTLPTLNESVVRSSSSNPSQVECTTLHGWVQC